MIYNEYLYDYLGLAGSFLIIFSMVTGILSKFKIIKAKYYKIAFAIALLLAVIAIWNQNHIVSKAKKQFKSELVDCKIYLDNKELTGKDAKDLLESIKKVKYRINGNAKIFSTNYGYNVELKCKKSNIALIISKSDYKDDIYLIATPKYTKKRYVELGKIRTKVLSKYKTKEIRFPEPYN